MHPKSRNTEEWTNVFYDVEMPTAPTLTAGPPLASREEAIAHAAAVLQEIDTLAYRETQVEICNDCRNCPIFEQCLEKTVNLFPEIRDLIRGRVDEPAEAQA